MPLYEYQCAKCGKVFEIIQRYSDAPLTVHEDCGGEVVKLLSAPAFHFKGSGWYATDYAKTSSSSPDKSHSEKDKGSESKSESKSDSTPAATTESKTESKPVAKTNE